MNIPSSTTPAIGTNTDSSVENTQSYADKFPSNENLKRVSPQTLNNWKAAWNNIQSTQPNKDQLNIEGFSEQHFNQPDHTKSKLEHPHGISLSMTDDQCRAEPTIQQLRAGYWQSEANFLPGNGFSAETGDENASRLKDLAFGKNDANAKNSLFAQAKPSEANAAMETNGIEPKTEVVNSDLRDKWSLKKTKPDQGPDISSNQNAVINTQDVSPQIAPSTGPSTTINDVELQTLLEKFCNTLYLSPQGGVNNLNNIVLDVSRSLPGTMIEISQQGTFLNIKIYSSDQETLRTMRRDKEKLSDGLSASTNLVVRVESIFRDQNNNSNSNV